MQHGRQQRNDRSCGAGCGAGAGVMSSACGFGGARGPGASNRALPAMQGFGFGAALGPGASERAGGASEGAADASLQGGATGSGAGGGGGAIGGGSVIGGGSGAIGGAANGASGGANFNPMDPRCSSCAADPRLEAMGGAAAGIGGVGGGMACCGGAGMAAPSAAAGGAGMGGAPGDPRSLTPTRGLASEADEAEDLQIKMLMAKTGAEWNRAGAYGGGRGGGFAGGKGGGKGGGGMMAGGGMMGGGGKGGPVGGPMGQPPPNYVCFRCNKPGHFIQACPTNGDPKFDKAVKPKLPVGIPKSMLKRVGQAPEGEDGAMTGGLVDRDIHFIVKMVSDDATFRSRWRSGRWSSTSRPSPMSCGAPSRSSSSTTPYSSRAAARLSRATQLPRRSVTTRSAPARPACFAAPRASSRTT